MNHIRVALMLVIWLTSTNVLASSLFDLGQPYFETVGERSDVTEGLVMALAQDETNFIWIGTQHGLIRFDGYSYKKYVYQSNNLKSLSGNFISVLQSTKSGAVWVGTEGEGLSIYSPESDNFTQIVKGKGSEANLSDNIIYALATTGEENLLVGTELGLDFIDANTLKITNVEVKGCKIRPIKQKVLAFHFDQKDNLWVGGSHGLCKISNASTLDYAQPLLGELYEYFNDQIVTAIFTSQQDLLFVGTRFNGGSLYHEEVQRFTPITYIEGNNEKRLTDGHVRSIVQANDKEIWLGFYGLGILVLDAESGEFKHHYQHDRTMNNSINIDRIGQLLVDESGLIWIGTWGGGLNRFNPSNNYVRILGHSPYNKSSLTDPDIHSILEFNPQQFWFGTGNNGFDIVDPAVGVIGGFRSNEKSEGFLPDKLIMSLLKESDSSVWIGTRHGGLANYNPQTKQALLFNKGNGLLDNGIRSLFISQENILWIGTDSGLNAFDLNKQVLLKHTDYENYSLLVGKRILTLSQIVPDEIWIGTNDGLFLLTLNKRKVIAINEHIKSSSSLFTNNYIHSALIDNDNKLWFGTDLGVIKLINWDGSKAEFESINAKLGLKYRDLGGNLLQDDVGRVWTDSGVIDTHQWRYHSLDYTKGWDVGTQWYGAYSSFSDGTLAYGGTEGVLIVNPKFWVDWHFQPPLTLNSIAIDNQEVPADISHLDLPAEAKSLSFEFTALDFSAPEKNQYAYKLTGYDDDWIHVDATKRRATYTNLPPANYTFHVKGTNSSGQWSPHQITLPITKLPMWYQTYWFKFALLFVILGLFFTVYKLRVNALKKQKAELNQVVINRTESINLLGEIGQDITSTLDFSSVLHVIYGHVNRLMGANIFLIGLYEANRNEIVVKFSVDEEGVRDSEYTYSMNEINRPAVWCINHRKDVVVGKLAELTRYITEIQPPVVGGQPESIIYTPLLVDEEVIGCISVQSYAQNAFDENDQQVLKTIASYAAIALSNAHSHQQLKEAQGQLVLSEKMAGLGTLTAGVAHEINNPTNFTHAAVYMMQSEIDTIKAFLRELAGGDSADEKVLAVIDENFAKLLELLSTASEGTKRIRTIVEDLRTFSRLDETHQQSVDISEIILSTVHLVKTQYHDIEITTADISAITLKCFPAKLAQVFMNVLVNACQAIESIISQESERKGLINIALEQQNSTAIITFKDNGCGMEASTRGKVFEPFYTTKDVGSGTGLGMAISYGIIEEHGGTIELTSTVNEGTQVVIQLPVNVTEVTTSNVNQDNE